MSIHAAAERTATTDVQAIEEMATAVLASIARIHADGLTAVATIAEDPASVRMLLPEAAAPVVEPVADIAPEAAEPEPEPVQLIRAAPPLPPRGRHLAEALTDQLPAQHAA